MPQGCRFCSPTSRVLRKYIMTSCYVRQSGHSRRLKNIGKLPSLRARFFKKVNLSWLFLVNKPGDSQIGHLMRERRSWNSSLKVFFFIYFDFKVEISWLLKVQRGINNRYVFYHDVLLSKWWKRTDNGMRINTINSKYANYFYDNFCLTSPWRQERLSKINSTPDMAIAIKAYWLTILS